MVVPMGDGLDMTFMSQQKTGTYRCAMGRRGCHLQACHSTKASERQARNVRSDSSRCAVRGGCARENRIHGYFLPSWYPNLVSMRPVC